MTGAPADSPHRAWCEERGHPGTTFNPLMNQTWCACGEVVTAGDIATHDLCCGTDNSDLRRGADTHRTRYSRDA